MPHTPETDKRPKTIESRVTRLEQLLAERDGALPVWIRSPKAGPEFFTGFSRAKLYELAGANRIRSVSIREPGQVKGTRLFHLASVLAYIEKNETAAALSTENHTTPAVG